MTRIALSLLVVAPGILMALGGCSCGPPKTTFDPNGKYKMEEIAQMLTAVKANNGRLPRRLEDLDQVEPFLPLSVAELRSGDLVYIWGADLASTGNAANAILAYEKKVASDEGWVLMQDGTVRQMTAAELSAAPKAR